MKIFKEKALLADYLASRKDIGFVPTMGALHSGHISLITLSQQYSQTTVCSIFVNPAQFNDKNDLLNYPRTLDSDCSLLEEAGCDVVFIPEVSEIYATGEVLEQYQFGMAEKTMEGEHRPGHFNGMANVVRRLFDIVKPQNAFFGEKDFQQLFIIQLLVKMLKLPITIVPGKIIREENGLAMSSRNRLLTEEEHKQAAGIYETLCLLQKERNKLPFSALLKLAENNYKKYPLIKPEYLQIAFEDTLENADFFDTKRAIRLFTAVRLGKVRLIDNLALPYEY